MPWEALPTIPPFAVTLFQFTFWASFFAAVGFPFYARRGMKLAKEHKLGIGPDGKPLPAFTFEWFYITGLKLLGSSFFVTVCMTLARIPQ